MKHAYAPYSGYPVGAALLDEQGRIFTGVNVENASYGLTICAERVALGAAVAAGARRLRAIAIASARPPAPVPCGACRQALAEFADADMPVYVLPPKGRARQFALGDLLPHGFRLRSPGRWPASKEKFE